MGSLTNILEQRLADDARQSDKRPQLPSDNSGKLNFTDIAKPPAGANPPYAKVADGQFSPVQINAQQVSRLLRKTELPALPPQSYLQTGIDKITSNFIGDVQTRHTVDHLAGEFVKTAAMFAVKRVGWGSVAVLYGLDQASPSSSYSEQAADFSLGAVKGVAIRSVFQYGGMATRFAPTKGVAMGIGSRLADDTLRRDTFTDPSAALERIKTNSLDWRLMALDAVVWTGAEATYGALNAYTRGALVRSPVASGVTMGATFGVMNGSGGELLRQIKDKESISVTKIAEQGLLTGVMSAAGAGAGIKGSLKYYEWREQRTADGAPRVTRDFETVRSRSDDSPKPPSRQFVITSGKETLEAFRANQLDFAIIKAREVTTFSLTEKLSTMFTGKGTRTYPQPLEGSTIHAPHDKIDVRFATRASVRDTSAGPEQTLYFQRLSANENKLFSDNLFADLLVTCYPENLTAEQRAKHAFPSGEGKVWMMTDRSNKLLLTNDLAPQEIRKYREGGFSEPTRLDTGQTKLDLMAPLLVGDPMNINSAESKTAWIEFDKQLVEAKKLGINSISTDIWWGVIEPQKGQFDFAYAEKLAEHIERAGLRWIPVLSFHKCGGNIGDNVSVPLPEWVWDHMAKHDPGGDVNAAKYKSEQGHHSDEYISLWSDGPAVELYGSVMHAFQDHFAGRRNLITEVNISLGPAGEMRYPSYNPHDQDAGYPTRGALQAYSEPAKQSFRDFVLKKYGDLDKVRRAWSMDIPGPERIQPPEDPKGFFERNDHHHLQYGRDFFDWYNQSLIDHGTRVMSKAEDVFSQKGAAFAGIDLGAKVPGVHWRVGRWENNNIIHGDRLAELAAGLIRTSRLDWQSDDAGRGYRPVMEMFRELHKKNNSDTLICPSFTCLELPDGDNGPDKMAMPYSLAKWFGNEGERQGLWLRGENALSFTLGDKNSWDRVRSHLFLPDKPGAYHGVTFLRMDDVVNNPDARAKLSEIINAIKSVPMNRWDHFLRLRTNDRPVKPAA